MEAKTRIDELIEKLNALDIADTGDLEEDIPAEIKAEYPELDTPVILDEDLNADEHRWYVLSTTVVAVGDEFMGVTVVSTVKSESMGVSDCGNVLEFFKMKKVTVESYVAA